METLETAHFKEVMGHFVTGVVVITANTDDGPAGFTCQTFGSLSLEPQLISFAATSNGQSWSRVSTSEVIGVSVLGVDQEAVARVFARSGRDKFDGVQWHSAPDGSPLLDGAIAYLEGRIITSVTHGDHDLVVVAVTYAQSTSGDPLLYFRGGFGHCV